MRIVIIGILLCVYIAVAVYDIKTNFLKSGSKNTKSKTEKVLNTKNLNPEEKEKFTEAMETADAYVYLGDDKKAVEEFKKAQKLNPNDRQTLYNLASSQHNAKLYEVAEETLSKLEGAEANSPDYWSFRATNIHKKPNSLKNINLAVEYMEKAYNLASYKTSPLFLENRASIYLEQYKYHRQRRTNPDKASRAEITAKNKFLYALRDYKDEAVRQNDQFLLKVHDDMYNQYIAFPDKKYKSMYSRGFELQKIDYTQDDIEKAKQIRRNTKYSK